MMLLSAILLLQVPDPMLMSAIRSAVKVGDKVAILRPPELAIPGRVLKYQWSGDGKTLLVFRQDTVKSNVDWLALMESDKGVIRSGTAGDPDGLNVEIWRYSFDNRVATRIYREAGDHWRPMDITPIPNSSAFVFTGLRDGSGDPGDFAGYFVAGNGKVINLSGPNDGYGGTDVSSATGQVIYSVGEYHEGKFSHWRAGILGPNGVAKSIDLPDSLVTISWSEDGKTSLAYLKLPPNPGTSKPRYEWQKVDWDSGQLQPYVRERKGSEPTKESVPDSGISLVPVTIPTGDIKQEIKSAVIFNKDESGLVAGDVSSATVSPSWNAVSYVAQGSLFVRPVVLVDKATFDAWRDKLAREEAIGIAKQVGTAFAILAADYDDELPSARTDWQKTVAPYIKNSDMIGRFNYTYGGGNLSKVKDPANEVMGYVPGPGGRAVVYVDCHVKWVKN